MNHYTLVIGVVAEDSAAMQKITDNKILIDKAIENCLHDQIGLKGKTLAGIDEINQED